MLHKGKLIVFFGSAVIALYGISAAFYGKVVATDQAYPALAVFMDALSKVSEDYVEAPDMNKVQEGALRGLIEALDPHSCFLTQEQLRQIEKLKEEGSVGIGAVLAKRGDVVSVVSVLEGSAAQQAAIRPGDYLISVDGVSTEYKSVIEADALLQGQPGSKVKVGVFRSARSQPVEIEISRAAGTGPLPEAKMLEDKVGLLDVSSLQAGAFGQVRPQLKTLISAGAERLVLDLRDCADGGLEEGVELANYFLREGVICLTKDRNGTVLAEARAIPEKLVSDLPLVVLINGSTSGPAEIAAGALKDHSRAQLVGEKTFGTGASQKRIRLKNGSAIVLSTAKYYTPNGKMIQEDNVRSAGIKPDHQSPDSDRRQDLLVESYYDDKEEAVKYQELRTKINREQLGKALEILLSSAPAGRKAA